MVHLSYKLEQHLAGHPSAYWVLRVFVEGKEMPVAVHTSKGSKGLKYLQDIRKSRFPLAFPAR